MAIMAKQHLIEKFIINQENVKPIKITESTKIIEQDGNQYQCRGAYEFPVWRLGEKNLNERVYGQELAEKLIQEQPTTLGLTNHPVDENNVDVGSAFAVERNPHIRDGIMYVDSYLVGEKGQLAKEILEAGGAIGLSSSAYGDVDKEGNVKLEGFEIDRFADWVDNPSYQVFAKQENQLENKETFNEDNTNIIDTQQKDWNYISNQPVAKEKKSMAKENKVLSIEEKNFKRGVKKMFEEASSKEDLHEKLESYQEILEYCDGVEIAEDSIDKASQEISKINEEIMALAEKAKTELPKLEEDSKKVEESKQELQEKLDNLQEKYDIAVDLLDNMKLREEKLKEMHKTALAEKNGMVTAGEYKEALVYAEEKDNEIEELKQEVSSLKKRIRTILEHNTVEEKKKEQDDSEDDKESMDTDTDEPEEEASCPSKKTKKESFEESDEFKKLYEEANTDVKAYYEDLVFENANVKEIAREILSCKTLMEAQVKYLNLKDLVQEDISIQSIRNYRLTEKFGEADNKKSSKPKSTLPLREGWN